MKAKTLNYLFVLFLIFSTIGCGKETPTPPPTPQPDEKIKIEFSQNEISLEQEQTTEISIKKGKAPFSITEFDKSIAEVKLANKTISIKGLKEGKTTLKIKGADDGEGVIAISVKKKSDPYAAFKADKRERVEIGDKITLYSTTNYIFLKDADGSYFDSPKFKLGYSNSEYTDFFVLEWEGAEQPGRKEKPSLRNTATATADLAWLEIVQQQDELVWIVAQEKGENKAIIKIVQER